jgi:hypothetical protein
VRDQATTQDGPRAAHVRKATTACGNPLVIRREGPRPPLARDRMARRTLTQA